MSYDLDFWARGEPAPSRAELRDDFSGRPHYVLLEHAVAPLGLVRALADAPAIVPTSTPSLVGFDQVLTREVLEKARAQVGRAPR